jgi:tetratricopeptide (TPR) repeat protein
MWRSSFNKYSERKRSRSQMVAPLLLLCCLHALAFAQNSSQVSFSRSTLSVPTYTISRSETVAPLFKTADSAALYPYARLDRDTMSRKPVPVRYEALTLENEYLRVVILPELGGRIWSARDKTANREIFYYTSVIKPTLYNQRGGWPAGNLEVYGPYDAHMLTWPGEPWPWAFRRDEGSATITLSHIDHFFRNKISMEVTLHAGRSFIELKLQLRNNNLLPNRYLLWTNAGIAATDGTRFVYPMTRTIGHDSAELSTWPNARGADLSWYKNNQTMLGVFALDLYDNFIGAYDYQNDYGTICWTDRRLARGVKTWTWGTGEAARRQMKHYTDTDGPYVEVQSGRFVWDGNYEFIEPGMSDAWTEYWFGTSKLGGMTTATRDAAIFFDRQHQHVKLAVTATGKFPNATLKLMAGETAVWSAQQSLSPTNVYRTNIALKPEATRQILKLEVRSASGALLARYVQHPDGSHPDVVLATDSIPRKFAAIEKLTAEEAFQKGLAHEKFGDLEEAGQAYRAALAKDGHFTAPHLRLGLIALERAQFNDAINHFNAVLDRAPTNGEAHYYLATAFSELGKIVEAGRHYFRLLPSSAKFDQREYGLGLLALTGGDFKEAAQRLSQAVATSPTQLSARQAYAFTLRKLGRAAEAQQQCEALFKIDPTNAFAYAERELFDTSNSTIRASSRLDDACGHHEQGYLELACEYLRLSAFSEARRAIERGLAISSPKVNLMLLYYRAYLADLTGDSAAARQSIDVARKQSLAIEIFPFRRETIRVLTRILAIEPKDANAACLLGELLYSRARQAEAMTGWRAALAVDPQHFSALRDLGLALLETGQADEAYALLTRAAEQRPELLSHTLLVAQLHAKAGNTNAARRMIGRALDSKPQNDRLIEALAMLEVQSGNPQRALEMMANHTFEPQHQSYALLHLWQAANLLESAKINKVDAIKLVRAAQNPPANLGVDDFANLRSARLLVFEALLEQPDVAAQTWMAAAGTAHEGFNEEGLFRAIALHKSGATAQAEEWFKNFLIVNERNKNSGRLRAQAHYLAGIHAAFRGQPEQGRASFRQSLELDRTSLWSHQALAWLDAGLFGR